MLSRHLLIKVMKCHRRDGEHRRRCGGLNRGHTRQGIEDTAFSKKVFRAKSSQCHLIGLPEVFEEADASTTNDKKLVAGFSFTGDDSIFFKFSLFGMLQKQPQGIILQPSKYRNPLYQVNHMENVKCVSCAGNSKSGARAAAASTCCQPIVESIAGKFYER